jgi:hypothetical protein
MPVGSFIFLESMVLKTRLRCRANGAEDASPGQRPGGCMPIAVARVFRRGDLSHDPTQNLASEEASYSSDAAAKKK